jgi:hypothetical protein
MKIDKTEKFSSVFLDTTSNISESLQVVVARQIKRITKLCAHFYDRIKERGGFDSKWREQIKRYGIGSFHLLGEMGTLIIGSDGSKLHVKTFLSPGMEFKTYFDFKDFVRLANMYGTPGVKAKQVLREAAELRNKNS